MVLETALLVMLYLILQHAGKSFFATDPIFWVYLKNCVFTVFPVEFVVRCRSDTFPAAKFIAWEAKWAHRDSGIKKKRYGALCTFELSTHWYRRILTLNSQVCKFNDVFFFFLISTSVSISSWPYVLLTGTKYKISSQILLILQPHNAERKLSSCRNIYGCIWK
jgi:hypothetical protein